LLYRGHQDMVWCMAKYQHKLLTAGKDKTIKVWDLDNLQRGCIKTIQGHTDTVGDLDIDYCKTTCRGAVSKLSRDTLTLYVTLTLAFVKQVSLIIC